jgi:hypothetical protein
MGEGVRMQPSLPAEGQLVVVQFAPTDISFTRAETTKVVEELIELRPIDPLSGEGRQGDNVRLIFTRAKKPQHLSVFCADDSTSERLHVAIDRRRHVRQPAEFTVDLTIVGEPKPIRANLVDLSLGGLKAEVRTELPVGLKASVMIGDDLGLGRPARVLGEVIEQLDDRVRMHFLSVNEATSERLQWLLGEEGGPAHPGDEPQE